jgi:hypothetical protein
MSRLPAPEGGFYACYAPGDGSLAFNHVDCWGRSTGKPVPDDVAKQLLPQDGTWKLTRENGHLRARLPVERIGFNVLRLGSGEYSYFADVDGYRFTHVEDGEEFALHSGPTKQCLEYFLRYENKS